MRQRPKRTATEQVFEDSWSVYDDQLVSMEVNGDDWQAVVRAICRQCGASVVLPVVDSESEARKVTLTLKDVPLRAALRRLAVMAGTDVRVDEFGVVHFGDIGVERVTAVPMGFLDPEAAVEVISAVAASGSTVRAVGSSIVVAGSRESCERAQQIGQLLQESEPGQWVVSVYVAELQSEFAQRLGLELSLSGGLAGIAGGGSAEVVADLLLNGILRADASHQYGRLLTGGMIVVLESVPALLTSIETVPVRTDAISQEGRVSTVQYESIDAGLKLELVARSVPTGVRLEVDSELSVVTGFAGDYPIIDKQTFDATAVVQAGGWLLLAGLDSVRDLHGRDGLGGVAISDSGSDTSVFLLIQIVDVDAGSLRLSSGGE